MQYAVAKPGWPCLQITVPGVERLSHNMSPCSLYSLQESRSLNLALTKQFDSDGPQTMYFTGVSPFAFLAPFVLSLHAISVNAIVNSSNRIVIFEFSMRK
jgi:hypothetical protein